MMIEFEGRTLRHYRWLDTSERRLIRQSARCCNCRPPNLPELSGVGSERHKPVCSAHVADAVRQDAPPKICCWGTGVCGQVRR